MSIDNETVTKILFGLYVVRNRTKDNKEVHDIIIEMIDLIETSIGIKD